MHAKFFKKNNVTRPTPNIPVKKENIAFQVAIIGYTLKNYFLNGLNYKDIENTFLDLINGSIEDFTLSKTFVDIAEEANVTISFISDDDPDGHYQCSRPNRISHRSDACIVLYDPTKQNCLDILSNIDNLRRTLAPLFFVGINGDIPEKHLFSQIEILERVVTTYGPDRISIYQLSLDPLYNGAKNIEIILNNLAITCLQKYEEIPITATTKETETKLLPSVNPLEKLYYSYAVLHQANKQQTTGIHGHFVPREIIQTIINILGQLLFKNYVYPRQRLDMLDMFMDKTKTISAPNNNIEILVENKKGRCSIL